ncbi:MAG: sulfatase-like hydrolase/transferase [Verrucomicrobiales bacterium]
MMKSLARLASFVALALCVPAFAAAADPPPNVIVIYTDDQGSVDMGAYGTKDIETPNMDRLAAGGVRFTQMLAPAPVCSPSRAGLMTGRVPQRAGVPGNVPSHHGGAGMPSEQITMAELFKGAGYATAHIGKWHLGYTPETMPNAQGFDYSFGHMGGCIDNFSHFFYWTGPNRHDLWRNGEEIHEPGQFFPALMVREASAFIEKNRAKPFFIYCAFNVPHYPYQGTPEWLAHYDEAGVAYPRNLYNAFVSTVDAQIGALLDRLEALGLRENTIAVLQSDHGHSTEENAPTMAAATPAPTAGRSSASSKAGCACPRRSAGPAAARASRRARCALTCHRLRLVPHPRRALRHRLARRPHDRRQRHLRHPRQGGRPQPARRIPPLRRPVGGPRARGNSSTTRKTPPPKGDPCSRQSLSSPTSTTTRRAKEPRRRKPRDRRPAQSQHEADGGL